MVVNGRAGNEIKVSLSPGVKSKILNSGGTELPNQMDAGHEAAWVLGTRM